MKKFYSFVLLFCSCIAAFSQATLLFNNGAGIYVKNGGFMIVKTSSAYNHNDQLGNIGTIDNQGTIVVEGDVKNDAVINGTGDLIRLQGNWINNNAYTGNNSEVEMYGGNQLITGTAVTTFDNLNLTGGAVVKKQTINAVTAGTLKLNDAELATDVNEMWVSNTNTGAITRNTGFVSSVNPGYLSRSTNSVSGYLYPTGSPSYVNPPSLFRPIQMTPAGAGADIYSVCMVKGDATADGYDVSVFDTSLCKVNPVFYHRLYHGTGNDNPDITMYFDPSNDGAWTDEAHWKNNLWNYIGASTPGNGFGFSTVTVNGVSDFTPNPFALARKKFKVVAGPGVNIYEGQSTVFNPNIGITGGNILWSPDVALSCDNCESPTASPAVTTEYTITVTDAAGCKASDSLLVTILNGELLVPTGFSPNGDGVNDRFRVLNKNLSKVDLQVFNRWGEKVFETTDLFDGWDGTYKGMQQELGVYVWQCNYTLAGDTKNKFAKGNVTLVR